MANLAEVVVYKDANWGGDSLRTNLDFNWVGSDWNDSISSIIVVSGTWIFYEDVNYGGAQSNPIGPGYYPWVESEPVNIQNDTISSFQCVSLEPEGI